MFRLKSKGFPTTDARLSGTIRDMDKEVNPVLITVVGLNGKVMLRLKGPINAETRAK